MRTFLLASTNPGDVVVDPFLGSGTTAAVAEQLGCHWKGCDLSLDYCGWAADRIAAVMPRTRHEWIGYDRANAQRRAAIR
jgi:site-specific DNA-methyltransferase (adenine-specific)